MPSKTLNIVKVQYQATVLRKRLESRQTSLTAAMFSQAESEVKETWREIPNPEKTTACWTGRAGEHWRGFSLLNIVQELSSFLLPRRPCWFNLNTSLVKRGSVRFLMWHQNVGEFVCVWFVLAVFDHHTCTNKTCCLHQVSGF